MNNTIKINENTGQLFTVVETDSIEKAKLISYVPGQYIIIDDGTVYYDNTIGSRILVTKSNTVTIKIIESTNDIQYKDLLPSIIKSEYTDKEKEPIIGDLIILKKQTDSDLVFEYKLIIYAETLVETEEEGQVIKKDWELISGDNLAKNTYFTESITITEPIPGITLENGVGVLNLKGASIVDLVKMIWAPKKEPAIEQPTAKIYLTVNGTKLESNVKYECGTILSNIGYEIITNSGNYQYGPDTNVTFNTINISYNGQNSVHNDKTGILLSSLEIDNNTNLQLDCNISHTNGEIPNMIPDGFYEHGQIRSNSINSKSCIISSYIPGLYYGVSTSEIINSNNITNIKFKNNNEIKQLNKNYNKGETVLMNVPVGTKTIILACPEEYTISNIYNNTVNTPMSEAFQLTENSYRISINNGNFSKNYKVWLYTPAEQYSIQASLTITL